jgi:hypothetical protein
MSQVISTCPRCEKPLVDPGGLGWCKGCGFCALQAESTLAAAKATGAPRPRTQPGLGKTGKSLGNTPIWVWVTAIGMAGIFIATIAGERSVRLTDLQRAIFTSVQIGAGVALMLLGQFIGLIRVAPDDSALSFKDMFVPFRLYSQIFQHLPRTQLSVYLCAWGLTAIFTAFIFVGGLNHWFTYLRNSSRPYVIEKVKD